MENGIYIVSTIMVIYAYYKSYSIKAEPNQSKYYRGKVPTPSGRVPL